MKKEHIGGLKTSFDPISNKDIEILILGSIPGEMSLKHKEYYANPRNRFWKIIADITQSQIPENYNSKKKLLLINKIGLWDTAYKAYRKGSLDSNIKNEIPNDLDNFISKHKKIKAIAFNGRKSEAIFFKYFKKQKGINYQILPSTSPANAGISYENLFLKWKEFLIN
jgi:hypoxanthine-DNA glycosylase